MKAAREAKDDLGQQGGEQLKRFLAARAGRKRKPRPLSHNRSKCGIVRPFGTYSNRQAKARTPQRAGRFRERVKKCPASRAWADAEIVNNWLLF